MKLFLFDINESDLNGFTELFTIIPYIDDTVYKKILDHVNVWNDGLYTRLRFDNQHQRVLKLEDCDVAVIPFKYTRQDIRINEYCKKAAAHGKNVVTFYNDDDSDSFDIPNNLILFRTSAYRNHIKQNERILPVVVPDHFPSHILLTDTVENRDIGFCGYNTPSRAHILQRIEQMYNRTHFIKRQGFFAPELQTKVEAKKVFYKNMLLCSFALCMRGNGNFSYRFYEALSFGRIPVVIESNSTLPFQKLINWSNHIILIEERDIDNIDNIINNCQLSPYQNRKLWQSYFSAEGYNKNFLLDI